MSGEIKIFEVTGASDWCAAATPEEAQAALRAHYGDGSADELLEEYGEPRELNDAELDRLKYFDEDHPEKDWTFRQELAAMIARGATFPCFFASEEI